MSTYLDADFKTCRTRPAYERIACSILVVAVAFMIIIMGLNTLVTPITITIAPVATVTPI